MINWLKDFLNKGKLLIIILILITSMSIVDPTFLHITSIYSIFENVTIMGILAIGMTYLLISGDFDLSIGAVLSLVTVVVIIFQENGIMLSVFVGLIVGLLVGAANGIIVVKAKVNSFIATLGTMVVAKGIALVLSSSRTVGGDNPAFLLLYRNTFFHIPLPIIYTAILYGVAGYLLKNTKFGKYTFGIGGNEHSAMLAGINVNAYKFFYFVFCSLMAAIAGILFASRTNTGSANYGDNFTLLVIAAVVLGGTSLFGGYGGVWGTFQAVVILGLIERAMIIFRIGSWYQYLVRGLIILIVVLISTISERRRKNYI